MRTKAAANFSDTFTAQFLPNFLPHCTSTFRIEFSNLCSHHCRRKFGEEEVGFKYVASGPLVRSSYRAGEFFVEAMIQGERASTHKSTTPAARAADQVLVSGVAVPVPDII